MLYHVMYTVLGVSVILYTAYTLKEAKALLNKEIKLKISL